MKCPFCGGIEDKVIDSRMIKDGMAIRRRRECLGCGKRFTSYETIEEIQLKVIKKDGSRENFDRNKIRSGIEKACEKRPVSVDAVEDLVDRIETELLYRGKKEVPSRDIGEMVIQALYGMDEVAYVRFASVYRAFKGIEEFDQFLAELKNVIDRESSTITRGGWENGHPGQMDLELIPGKLKRPREAADDDPQPPESEPAPGEPSPKKRSRGK